VTGGRWKVNWETGSVAGIGLWYWICAVPACIPVNNNALPRGSWAAVGCCRTGGEGEEGEEAEGACVVKVRISGQIGSECVSLLSLSLSLCGCVSVKYPLQR
jgi:hypothetical protein